MPKILPPESGHNVKDELDNIRANPSAYLLHMRSKIRRHLEKGEIAALSDFKSTEEAATDLMDRINPDICCNERQYLVLLDQLFRLIKIRSNDLQSSSSAQNANNGNEEYSESDANTEKLEKYNAVLSEVTAAVNSFRLACLNCINEKCTKRNSKTSIADVLQRAHKIIMS